MSSRALAAARLGLREQRRRPLLIVLLIVIPFWFIRRAISVTEPLPRSIGLPGGDQLMTTMREVHGADMALITVGLLVGLCGVFLMLSARAADRRLVVAGFRPAEAIAARLIVLLTATVIVVAVSVAVTASKFEAQHWLAFTLATALIGLQYGAIGALAGAAFGRVSAVYVVFFASILDLGIAQNPMFGDGTPDGWAVVLPGWAASRVAMDAAFSATFHAGPELLVAFAWTAVLLALLMLGLRRVLRTDA